MKSRSKSMHARNKSTDYGNHMRNYSMENQLTNKTITSHSVKRSKLVKSGSNSRNSRKSLKSDPKNAKRMKSSEEQADKDSTILVISQRSEPRESYCKHNKRRKKSKRMGPADCEKQTIIFSLGENDKFICEK